MMIAVWLNIGNRFINELSFQSNAFIMEEESATLEDFGVKNNSHILIEGDILNMPVIFLW